LRIGFDGAVDAVGRPAQIGRDVQRPACRRAAPSRQVLKEPARAPISVPPLRSGLGDDVDDAGKGVRAIQRRTGAADDFDARDMLDRIAAPDIALVADVGGGDGHAVLQHQDLRREGADDAAHHVQRRIAVGRAVDVDAGHAFQYLVEVRGAHGGDVGRGDHVATAGARRSACRLPVAMLTLSPAP
jgi:hypothetical protein